MFKPAHFRENKGSMSTDWCKYSTPAETRGRRGRTETFGVVQLPVDLIRAIDGVSVDHEPDPDTQNQAHTGVYGVETKNGVPDLAAKERVRTALYNASRKQWIISPSTPVRTPNFEAWEANDSDANKAEVW